jgi:hypothetical protein
MCFVSRKPFLNLSCLASPVFHASPSRFAFVERRRISDSCTVKQSGGVFDFAVASSENVGWNQRRDARKGTFCGSCLDSRSHFLGQVFAFSFSQKMWVLMLVFAVCCWMWLWKTKSPTTTEKKRTCFPSSPNTLRSFEENKKC